MSDAKKELKNSAFLDGDWCWVANPFQVNDETKGMVIDNICHLLNNFIHCSVYDNVIFCWVMHEQNNINDIVIQPRFSKLRCQNIIFDLQPQ